MAMQELVKILVRALVDEPQEVEVTQVEGNKSVIIEVRAASGDVGKIIGKQGRIIRAIRTVVKAAAAKEGKRATVEILQ